MKNNTNDYHPYPARILRVIEENSQIKTFELAFTDEVRNKEFTYRPGQFLMVSVPHYGEAPISIASTPTKPQVIELSVRRAGTLTNAMHDMKQGDVLGLRGPYGKPFPLESLKGRDLLFVGGGIGLAPLRSLINYCLDYGNEYGKITLLYGSRSPEDIAFSRDLSTWQETHAVSCLLSVDNASPNWQGHVGLVTTLLDQVRHDPDSTSAIVCGPSIMIRFVLAALSRIGFSDDNIITTLERHMKCGIGVCRHCHMDKTLVCADGPVFSLAQLRGMQGTEVI